ncbi:patatin-like phospholipase family protein [Chromobacterium haemolyticum]|uniref:Patatin-like phospholipase family protein n=1 Tax=Chromobacterium haemolyticum TaxID=394935 RepID=A0ABS3GM17_9NEIS|nr:patatin-like phospholipase family protein [Chromobacterium haemolyticum]MBK0414709.1 patatin-like phospholipase family protein [Chromobacterium haemolyticum]MBO0416088.1 patatin-like phospholipase family protein [Chromobacterium haemolyticum]MBO0499413.1 patatin-like phospholipase family protein [Chromobacterium haemolyticum]MDH0342926.1 patatin-like phospholipase family protein [Chromobacterium haemolyticum]OQS39131.1 Patatin [Chromobacterium haemolyticum]
MMSKHTLRPWLLAGMAALLSACTTLSSPPAAVAPKPALKPKIGLALGGGAAKGFAHVGVIKVLEAAGLTPDLVTGTSAGSVVGSLYASGLSGMQLQSRAIQLDESNLTDWTLSSKGVIKGEKLQNWINAQVANKTMEQLPRPFGAVATELDSGRKVVFRLGNTGQAVRASASIPNVFLPVKIGNKSYVDGGLVSPVPVSAAREMGADFVIAVDISARPRKGAATGFLSMLDQSLNIMNGPALAQELKQADVVIRPQVQNIGSAQFDARHQAILEGERAAQAALPQIRQLLQQKAIAMNK